MHPMPSGAGAHQGGQGVDAAMVGTGGGAERADLGRVAAMGEAGAAGGRSNPWALGFYGGTAWALGIAVGARVASGKWNQGAKRYPDDRG